MEDAMGKKAVVPWQAVRTPASGARAVKCGSHDKTELPSAVKHKVSWVCAYCSLGREEFLDIVFGDKS